MGMFDSVMMDCPACGAPRELEFQSKTGPCAMKRYTADNSPPEVLIGVHEDLPQICSRCGRTFAPVIVKKLIATGLKLVRL